MITDYDWWPTSPSQVAIASSKDIEVYDCETGSQIVGITNETSVGTLSWCPKGEYLAWVTEQSLKLYNTNTNSMKIASEELYSPANTRNPTPITWSPSDEYFLTAISKAPQLIGIGVFERTNLNLHEHHVPTYSDSYVVSAYDWVSENRLVFVCDSQDRTYREFRVLTLAEEVTKTATILKESDRVLASDYPVGNGENKFAIVSGQDGYHHMYIIDVDGRLHSSKQYQGFDGPGVSRVTKGEFEARSEETTSPAWGPEGNQIAYVTNKKNPGGAPSTRSQTHRIERG